jgi:membrane protein DedA with SNARE-associated domain
MLHELMSTWFGWVRDGGYAGIFWLMLLESTIVPIPSEVVIPPAAYWAAQGRLSLPGVVVAGTAGSWAGASICYFVSAWLGRPLLERYGRYVGLTPDKLAGAERLVLEYANGGVFVARLLPVVRHLIGFPAGLLRIPFAQFSVATLMGSALWCTVLAVFGQRVLGPHPELLDDPEGIVHVMKAELGWFVIAAVALFAAWILVKRYLKKGVAPA